MRTTFKFDPNKNYEEKVIELMYKKKDKKNLAEVRKEEDVDLQL